MKIEKLRLRGFIGVKKGMGLNEIEIDFTGKGGLVAFAGDNGRGKTVCLESLSPFNQLVSRDGALSHHCFLRDSERELSFEYNGDHYRTLLKIDAQSGKSEGFIWRNGESLINGKIRDYSKKITELFGSSNLFYNSVFCGQNSTKLSDMTTGELKTLFAEFLRLDRLQGFEETAKQIINVLTGKVAQIDVDLEVIRKRLEGAQDTRGTIDRLNISLEEQKTIRGSLSAKLADAQQERDRLKEVVARNEVFSSQADELASTIRAMEKNRDDEEKQVEGQLDKLRTQFKQLAAEIVEADEIIAHEASISVAAETKKTLEVLIESLAANLEHAADNVTAEQKTVTELEKDVQELKNNLKATENDATLAGIDREIAELKQKIIGCSNQLAALDKRHPECTINGCSFIVAALQAQEELPLLTDRLESLRIDQEIRKTELKAAATEAGGRITEKETALKEARVHLNDLAELQKTKRQDLATNRLELTRYQNTAEKQAALAVAKSKKEDRIIALDESKTQGLAISEAWTAKKKLLDDQIEEQGRKLLTLTASIDATASISLAAVDSGIEKTTHEIHEAEQAISETSTLIAKLQGELEGMADAEEQLRKTNEDKIRANAGIADWTYIRNACGKNGLQALEIDGAAPIITGFANDLLSKAFGSLYTVKFRTQDDEGKECLDIITITDDGEEVLLDNLSGGQRVWILMALRLAMTLLSKEKGGRNFETAFFDEMDGALDPDNAVNFVNLYKSFMSIGRFSTIPFISHKPECRHMADHVLNFEKDKNPYWN